MWALFRTLILRPLRRDPLRSALTLIAVALGVAVVIAIDLAGGAAAGSFQSSLTTVAGKVDLEVHANGGVDERTVGWLSQLPVNARFAPAMEATLRIPPAGYVTVYGIDLVAEAREQQNGLPAGCGDDAPAFATDRLAEKLPKRFPIGARFFCVVKTFASQSADFIAIDIADMQQALNRYGKLDRIDVFLSPNENPDRVERAMRSALPPGYSVTRPGARSQENQKMLRAFRWNLNILSYIALVVGAFLIYNTISISVVRRRPEIGILRALGAGRGAVMGIFLFEAAIFGLGGAALGLAGGRLLAEAMVALIAQTVRSLYTSSAPAPIHLGLWSIGLSFVAGLGMALISAWGPAREAMEIVPTEAMGRGSREASVRVRFRRNFYISAVSAVLAWAASTAGPVDGKPIFGYIATVLSILAAATIAPAVVMLVNRALRSALRLIFGAVGVLASRSLAASLSRTSVVVAALATAIAMMASVGIMVGSFRETVLVWLEAQLRADLYMRAAGPAVAGEFPPIPAEAVAVVRSTGGVQDVDLFSAIPLSYEGVRATLGAGDLAVQRRHAPLHFADGSYPLANQAIVSEPFAEKHRVHSGDRITIQLGEKKVTLRVSGIYYEYSSEQGYVIIDRATLLEYLPGQAATNIAIYLKPGADAEAVRKRIEARTAQYPVSVAANAELRREAVTIFDRTFAITWALEGVAIIVAMLGAANSLLALVLDRRREIGMLRYLGAASRQVRGMILVEAGLIGLFALILGTALGLVLSRLLIFTINKQSFGWTIQFHLPAAALAGAMFLILAVTVLAGLYPARVATRLKPIEVIHEE